MRRLILFVAFVALGLGVLYWIQLRHAPPAEPRPAEQPAAPRETDRDAFTEVPLQAGDEKDGPKQSVEFRLDGALDFTARDPELRRRYRLSASDVDWVGADAYDLKAFHADLFDPESDALTTLVDATRARLKLATEPLGLDESYPVTLHDVVMKLERDYPFVPLAVRIPVLEGRLSERRLSSRESVELDGAGLRARGTGLEADGARATLELVRDARVELTFADGRRATLTSVGGLVLRRLEAREQVDVVEIEARGGAALDFVGDEVLGLTGERIVLVGELARGHDARFKPSAATGSGAMQLSTARDAFRGDRGELAFDAAGKPSRAKLEGNPTVELPLEPPENIAGVAQAPTSELPELASGVGPLEVTLNDPTRFDFHGPVTATMPELDATLHAGGGVRGEGARGSRFQTLETRGGTVVDAGGSRLETTSITVSSEVAVDGNAFARLFARGPTTSSGALPDGRGYLLSSERGFVLTQRADTFEVARAYCIDLRVIGENGFYAHADELVDFDARDMTFAATGNVFLDNATGRGRGERLLALETGSFELSGEPATVHFEQGDARARWFEYGGRRVVARDDVHADVRIGERTLTLDSRWLAIEEELAADPLVAPIDTLDARGDVHAYVESPGEQLDVFGDTLKARGRRVAADRVASSSLEVVGNVSFDYRADFDSAGSGQRLTVDELGVGKLEPAPNEKVALSGSLPKDDLSYEMVADLVTFTRNRLDAVGVDLELNGAAMPLSAPSASDDQRNMRAVAGHMSCDAGSILFTENVYFGGLDPREQGWSLDANQALITANRESGREGVAPSGDLIAWGACEARLGEEIQALGDTLQVSRAEARATLTGDPAVVLSPPVRWEAGRLEWDLETNFVRSTSGALRSRDPENPWTLTYESLEQVEGVDETIQVMREPRLERRERSGSELVLLETRASWLLFWVDKQEWARLTGGFYREESSLPTTTGAPRKRARFQRPSLFTMIDDESGLGELINEVYLEGNIESLRDGDRLARADTIYLDYADGHGWIENADVQTDWPVPGAKTDTRLKVHARWLRHSADGSFRADDAVITTCEFDRPHYTIKSGDLSLLPNPRRPGAWNVAIRQNAIVFENGFSLPLPRIAFPLRPKRTPASQTDGDLSDAAPAIEKPSDLFSWENLEIDSREASIGGIRWLSIGSHARFGTFIGTEIQLEPGKWLKKLDSWLGGPQFGRLGRIQEPEGGTSVAPKYLDKRGLLLALESQLERDGLYKLDLNVDGIVDGGDDRGLVRVDADDRSSLRAWLHGRGRYWFEPDAWLDVVFTQQSDEGVQAEFFESEFLEFEERESYVHWRKAIGETLISATAEARLEGFRTEVVEQPSVDLFRGRSEIARLGPLSLLYASSTQLAYLKLYDGDAEHYEPFPSSISGRDVLMVDTAQRVEAPQGLGLLGLIATPYLEGRGTMFDEGATDDEHPARAGLLAGVDLATSFWRRWDDGSLHVLTPEVGLRSDVVVEERDRFDAMAGAFGQRLLDDDPTPPTDPTWEWNRSVDESLASVERPFEGRFLDLKLRSRWSNAADDTALDFEIVQTYATRVAAGEPAGWLPFEASGEWYTFLGPVPFAVKHDARYDLADDDTEYSRTQLGFRVLEDLSLETAYNSGRPAIPDPTDLGDRLYDAFSVGARYRFTDKWEIEARETMSRTRGRLSSNATIRRFGHDFVFEFEASFVSGEGSNTFGINLVPLLVYRGSKRGLIDRWLDKDD